MKRSLGVALAILACGALVWAQGDDAPKFSNPGRAPEIPALVQFAGDSAGLSLQNLKGKVVMVIFFQSWCPICNGWSGELFKQVQEAGGGRRDVVLAAVKTDGGGTPGAIKYLQGRADADQWLIGADPNAVWTQATMGVDELYQYMIIGPDGTILDCGKAGVYYERGDRKDFVPALRLKKILEDAKAQTVLPKDSAYPDVPPGAVRAVEFRQYGAAIKLCDAAARTPAKDAAAAFKADVLRMVDDRSKALSEVLGSTSADGGARLEAYLELKKISKDFGTTKTGMTAVRAVKAAARDKALASEIQAGQEYTNLHQQASKVKNFARNSEFVTALTAVAEKHPDTKFGKMAADEVRRLTEAPKGG